MLSTAKKAPAMSIGRAKRKGIVIEERSPSPADYKLDQTSIDIRSRTSLAGTYSLKTS